MICCRHFLIEESLPPLAASSAYQICLHPFVVSFVIRGTVASVYMAIAKGSAFVVPFCDNKLAHHQPSDKTGFFRF